MLSPDFESGRQYSQAEIGALSHLYRGEIYRSTSWRSRLDATTNWAVVSLGVALSISFASPTATPLPLVLVGILIFIFLMLESRRYRYFNVWRARARWLECQFFARMLMHGDLQTETGWQDVLAQDYRHPHYHISLIRAVGRRLRRNYIWILLIQTIAYFGKVMIHPTPLTSMAEFWARTDVGPIPGHVLVIAGLLYNGVAIGIALTTLYHDRAKHVDDGGGVTMG